MAIALPNPRRKMEVLQLAVSDWRCRRRTGLSTEEIVSLYHAIWSQWWERLTEELKYCQRHARSVYFELVWVIETNGQVEAMVLERCPGDQDLHDGHTGIPHEFLAPRGAWEQVRETSSVRDAA